MNDDPRHPGAAVQRAAASLALCAALALGVGAGAPDAAAQAPAHDGASAVPARDGTGVATARIPLLSLSATAYRDVVQDRVTVTLYAEREAPQPAVAQAQVSELLGPALDQLKGRPGLEVQSSGYRTDPVWQQGRIAGWRTRGSLRVTAQPSEAFNRMVGELATRLGIESVSHWLSREAQLAVERELIAEALQAWRAKADTAAQALGFARHSVREVSLDASGSIPPQPVPRAMMARAAGAEAAPLPAAEGRTTVTVTASGRVALER